MLDTLFDYFANSSAITIIVLALLSLYLFIIFWIFIYKYISISSFMKNEKNSLESLVQRGNSVSSLSRMSKCASGNDTSKEMLKACEISLIRDASSGISWLAIVSSTSPFIGLFGTVIGILESFAQFSNQAKVSFATIAPAISEALVATAAGIFVAIFAYTFHQILTRMIYELNTYLKAHAEILLSKV
jgi:biopolymer transport protein ExbB/TolQ